MNLLTNGYTVLKMKKNPIDELFASKLKEHRLEPSQRALERFNERLDQKNSRKVAPWYFGAAASVALVSFGLYVFNQNETPITVATTSNKAKVDSKTAETKFPELAASVKMPVMQKSKNSSIITTLVPFENTTVQFENKVVLNTDNLIPEPVLLKEEVLIEDSKEVFANGNLKPSSQPQLIRQNNEEDIILTYEVEIMPQERLRRFDEEPIGLAQAIQFEEYYFLHKKESNEEPTILTKIGHQFQHIKKGEKVNFRELGLRPRDLVAKADRFLHEKLGIENASIKTNKNIHSFGN